MLRKEPGFSVENKLCLRGEVAGRGAGKRVRRRLQQFRAEMTVVCASVEMVLSPVLSLTGLLVLKGAGSALHLV